MLQYYASVQENEYKQPDHPSKERHQYTVVQTEVESGIGFGDEVPDNVLLHSRNRADRKFGLGDCRALVLFAVL